MTAADLQRADFRATDLQAAICEGLPATLPPAVLRNPEWSHAPVRKDILTDKEKTLALRNALRYFPEEQHAELAPEFAKELRTYGRIYMYRLRPRHAMKAYPIEWYPAKCRQAASVMLMIQNNLDPAVAQHPEELITYGGNGACLLYTSPSPRDATLSRMPSSA